MTSRFVMMGDRHLSSLRSLFLNDRSIRGNANPAESSGPSIILIYSSTILCFLFSSILVSSIGFILGIPITSNHFFIASGFTLSFAIILCFILSGRNWLFKSLFNLGLVGSSFYFCLMISQHFWDISYDGQAYHQEALIQLARGWNPFYELLNGQQANRMDYWLNHYSKGVWIYATMVFKVTQDIESGKVFHLWLITAAFLITLSFLWRFEKCPRWLAFLISVLAAFNPVALYQSLSFYLDGQLMSCMVILIAVLGLIYRESRWIYYVLLFMVLPVLVNIKLTAGIYSGMIIMGYLGILWMKAKYEELRKAFLFSVAGFAIGFILMGFNPYVTNTIHKGNPFYPALGTDRSYYTFPQFPANFIGKNSFSLLFFSIFAKSDNVRGVEKKAELKIPFWVSREELRAFTDTNAKQGGFGPLFGGAILLSFLIILGASLRLYRGGYKISEANPSGCRGEMGAEGRADIILGLSCLGLLLSTCLINPASSLARFIPQMWFFPLITVILACSFKDQWLRVIGYLIIVTLLVNNLLVGITYYQYNFEITKIYHERLGKMAARSKEKPIPLYFGHFRTSNTLRFDRLGIRYRIVENREECWGGKRILPNSIILECVSKE